VEIPILFRQWRKEQGLSQGEIAQTNQGALSDDPEAGNNLMQSNVEDAEESSQVSGEKSVDRCGIVRGAELRLSWNGGLPVKAPD